MRLSIGGRSMIADRRSRPCNRDTGFVYDIAVVDGAVRITMTATTPGCPAIRFLKEGVANAAARVPGIGSVDVVMTFDPPWAPSRIAPAVRASLGFAAVN
jgi:metal-sulfur cluster biosynthetic enzyme